MRQTRILIALLAVLLAAGTAAPVAAPAAVAKHQRERAHKPKSPFTWRGVIEGFYGTPWTHGDRMRMIRWMGAHGFNAYVHAPKGDVYQTSAWRLPYPASVQHNFDDEIAVAARHGVQWIPNISPARGPVTATYRICFSCAGDLDTLVAKLQPFLDAGAHTVMVSFDDIAPTLGPTDAAAYGARFPGTPPEYQFGRATADFLNALLLRLPPHTRLLTVLPDYHGTTDSPYLQGTRDGALDPAIGVLWTGPRTRATMFKPAEAAAYGQLIDRTPIVWDNWVTRDFVPSRIFLGPFRARRHVANAVQGFFFNPANEPDLNMLPLDTAGTYLQDPDHYDAGAAWLAAVDELAGGRDPLVDELRAFAETSYSSDLLSTEAPTSTRLEYAFLRAYAAGARWTDAAQALEQELALVVRARRGLRGLRDRNIARQAARFTAAAARLASIGQGAVDMLTAERPSLILDSGGDRITGRVFGPDPAAAATLRSRVATAWAAARTSPLYVFGCRVPTRGCGPRPYNRMDDFLTKATALDAEWAPNADLVTRRLRLTMGGRRIGHGADGTFTLPAGACGTRVLAIDGAGGQTSLPLPACPRHTRGHP